MSEFKAVELQAEYPIEEHRDAMSKSETAAVIEDFLEEDTEIPGQRYALVSFISPEKVLDRKDLFFFHQFMKSYEVDWKVKNLEKFLVDTVKSINSDLDEKATELEKADQFDAAQLCRKNRLRIDDVMDTYAKFIQKSKSDLTKSKIVEAYDDYLFANKVQLEKEFHAANDFQTTIRGLKIRGVYASTKEAEMKAKKLQARDKYHNIFMAEVGKWTPWDPSPHEVQDQEYVDDRLNNLMKKYKENEDSREKFFEERTQSSKQVFGANTSATASSAASDSSDMFRATGDLALQRKMERSVEKPAVTLERVSEEPVASASASASAAEQGDEKSESK